ncbi:MAG: Hsp33 family molecular chaperone HslO [Opitutales bacterium]
MEDSDPETTAPAPAGSTVESLFVRHRNCLLARADLSHLLACWEQHVAHNYEVEQRPAEAIIRLRGALAAFTLHCASRPRNEHIGWTINFQQPLLNLFLVGDTRESTVAGRFFVDNVKQATVQSFYQELIPANREGVRSHIHFTGDDPLLAAEQFYERSEQRPARFFQLSDTDFAILSAHPDWDQEWFYRTTLEDIRQLDDLQELSPLEQRYYRWGCGCSTEKLLRVIEPMIRPDIDALFESDESITANCPRCGARYTLTREAAEAYLTAKDEEAAASSGEAGRAENSE